MSLIDTMISQKILICLGNGGVGKTTVSASLGVVAAQQGKNVLVLTIDPAKRLATALGLESNKNLQKIEHSSFKGSLHVGLLNHQEVFLNLLKQSRLSEESMQKIAKNKLFEQLTTGLSGSQDFSALEYLYNFDAEKKYDLIVLDTPPSHHAVNFLRAPENFSKLFSAEVFDWIFPQKKGFFQSVIATGSQQALKVLEKLTGSNFISELTDFFKNIYTWRSTLENRVADIHKLLHQSSTGYVLVTSYDPAKLRESSRLISSLRTEGFLMNHVVVNRVLPTLEISEKESSALLKIKKFQTHMKNFLNQFITEQQNHIQVLEIPEQVEAISGLEDIVKLADYMTETYS